MKGREKLYFGYFWNDLAADKNRSLKTADRNAYVKAYSRPGRMRAGWAYFAAWPETAKDFAEMAKTKLTMPVLSIAGEKASAAILAARGENSCFDVRVNVSAWTCAIKEARNASAFFKSEKRVLCLGTKSPVGVRP